MNKRDIVSLFVQEADSTEHSGESTAPACVQTALRVAGRTVLVSRH